MGIGFQMGQILWDFISQCEIWHVWTYSGSHGSFVEIGHEIISPAILSLPLIQVGQLSITGEKICPVKQHEKKKKTK